MDVKGRSALTMRPPKRAKLIDEPVAVVIVNYRTPKLTANSLAALTREKSAFRKLQVVVVDGGSADGSAEELSALIDGSEFRKWVSLVRLSVNGGFGWANNQAIQRLMRTGEPPEFIHVLNPDAEVESDAVRSLAKYLNSHPRVAAVGSQLVEPDGVRTGSAFSFPSIRGEFSRGARTGALDRFFRVPPITINPSVATEVDWVTGASVMFRTEALRQVGLFDEGFFLYNEEIELMWRLRSAGWTIATEPRSVVRHIGGSATGVHGRESGAASEPRRPAYMHRSRSRFFGLTRGRAAAMLAFSAWLAGNAVWRARRLVGVSTGKPRDHEFRDHFLKAFPRKHDFEPAVTALDGPPTTIPAWMEKRWL